MNRDNFTKKSKLWYLLSVAILTASTSLNASATNFLVTISGTNMHLETVFAKIEAQTGLIIIYNKADIRHAKNVDLDFVNRPVERILDHCFYKQPYFYKIYEHRKAIAIVLQTQKANTIKVQSAKLYPSASLLKHIEVMLILIFSFLGCWLIFHKAPARKACASIVMGLGLGNHVKDLTRHCRNSTILPARIARYLELKLLSLQGDIDAISPVKENKLYKRYCLVRRTVSFLFFVCYLILFIIWLKEIGTVYYLT
jgi:hypothetical protein